MQITNIHSFLVKPLKGTEEKAPSGTSVPLAGKLYDMLAGVFNGAENECIFEIAFCPDEHGAQNNLCRDLIIDYVEKGTMPPAAKLALRLQSLTDHRSGLGLLFLIRGKQDNKQKLVISRFPADSGVLADEQEKTLTVQFLERIFMKSSRFYKSAVYQGTSFENHFWDGRAIDKQMSGGMPMADYWIKEFLLSDLTTPGLRGSRWVGSAMREAYNETTDADVKEEIIAAIRLAGPLNATVVSTENLLTRMNLGERSKALVISKVPQRVRGEHFSLDVEEMRKIAAFKSVHLDTGVRITADAPKFDELVSQTNGKEGKTLFSTEGVVVEEVIRKSNK